MYLVQKHPTHTVFYSAPWFMKIMILRIQGLFQALEKFHVLQTWIFFLGLNLEKKLGL